MDHLKIYLESAFCLTSKFLIEDVGITDFSVIPEKQFLSVARSAAPSLSDDVLRLIHRLSLNNWNYTDPREGDSGGTSLPKSSSVFSAIFEIAGRLIINDGKKLKVRFPHLFKWRDITRLVGEDLPITSFLASEDAFAYRGSHNIGERLSYPCSLHNDNPDIEWLIRNGRLHELHSHLNASANVFNINWVCLMNHPSGRHKQIKKLLAVIEDVGNTTKTLRIQELIIKAASFRFHASRFLKGEIDDDIFRKETKALLNNKGEREGKDLESLICAYKEDDHSAPDYILPSDIPSHSSGDFRIYLGERYFLYLSMLRIIREDDAEFVSAFRFYLLVKSILRGYMIQLNTNHGFANFKRYQDVKSLFVRNHPMYSRMLGSLAIADAWRDSNIAYQEVRIAPEKTLKDNYKNLKATCRFIDSELNRMSGNGDFSEIPGYGIIYHFIKLKDPEEGASTGDALCARNHNVRKDLRQRSYSIRSLYHRKNYGQIIKAIDAASSEFNCRPEVFGQAFRFLKNSGLGITFHAGEDFYDLADGLRSIDEAVTFLGMESGDRIGHAIAMGCDAHEYYKRCENHIIVPAQWMLDNVAWLLFRSADWNIELEPSTKSFLRSQFQLLYTLIYMDNGDVSGANGSEICTEQEYFQSLLLRGDCPEWYVRQNNRKEEIRFSDSWENFELLNYSKAKLARSNSKTRLLYKRYHFDSGVRKRGAQIIEFKVCEGYARLIDAMQHKMMHRLERKHIVIECCPSSNLLIGSLEKFRKHPAFRFYSVGREDRHHLKVTLNTDDLGVFQTSLANEYSFMALALAKEQDKEGQPAFMPYQINQWLSVIARNGEKCRF